MTKLNCNAATCAHNKDNLCCLPSINVAGNDAKESSGTCCGSFDEEKTRGGKNTNDAPKFNLSISCAAKNCIYNQNSRCEADHVSISGIRATDATETVCTTFQNKM